jgi:voltage-gated potassium channel
VSTERRLGAALAAIVTVLTIGTIGYRILGASWLDALYQTVTTVTTIGFREVIEFGDAEKLFTIVVALAGVSVVLYTLTALMDLVVQGHVRQAFSRRRTDRRIKRMHDHVVICGWGRVGRAIAETLKLEGTPFVVVESDRNASRASTRRR